MILFYKFSCLLHKYIRNTKWAMKQQQKNNKNEMISICVMWIMINRWRSQSANARSMKTERENHEYCIVINNRKKWTISIPRDKSVNVADNVMFLQNFVEMRTENRKKIINHASLKQRMSVFVFTVFVCVCFELICVICLVYWFSYWHC